MPNLDTLPTEIHVQIFSNLDPASSTCLGLSSKKFYSVYGDLYGVGYASLLSRTSFRGIGKQLCLFELLKDWMGYRIVPPLLEAYERLAKEWNDVEVAQVAFKMVNTLPREKLDALLGR
jgi:hypothetical protein